MLLLLFTWLLETSSARLKAPPSELLRCLGQQEKVFHAEKATGALYDLNQKMIAELVQLSGVDGTPLLVKEVCRSQGKGALYLLEAILLDANQWYLIRPQTSALGGALSAELVKELNSSGPELLLSFLGALQMESPTPDCLEKNIPGVSQLYFEVKWLQEEIDLQKIAGKKKRLAKIFGGIHRAETYFAACAREKSKKMERPAGKPSAQ